MHYKAVYNYNIMYYSKVNQPSIVTVKKIFLKTSNRVWKFKEIY